MKKQEINQADEFDKVLAQLEQYLSWKRMRYMLRSEDGSILDTIGNYRPDQAETILAFHRNLFPQVTDTSPDSSAEPYTGSAYFELTARDESCLAPAIIDEEICQVTDGPIQGSVRVKVGSLSAFTQHEMACEIHEQIARYVEMGTMGDFPNKSEAQEELVRIMTGGYASTCLQAMIYFEGTTENAESVIKPLSGVRIQFGNMELPLEDLIGNPSANLSTLSALELGPSDLQPHPGLAETPVNKTACFTRFFNGDPKDYSSLEIPNSNKMAWLGLAYLGAALPDHCKEHNLQPDSIIFDTHLPYIMAKMAELYDATAISNDARPTNAVMDSVLKHHYGSYEIIFASVNWVDFITRSQEYVEEYKQSMSLEPSGGEVEEPDRQETAKENLAKVAPELIEACSSADEVERVVDLLSDQEAETPRTNGSIEIIDHHTPAGEKRLKELIEAGALAADSLKPFQHGSKEIQELKAFFRNSFPRLDEAPSLDASALKENSEFLNQAVEQVRSIIIERLSNMIPSEADITREEIEDAFNSTTIIEDLTYLAYNIAKRASPESLQEESRYIYDQANHRLVKVIGAEADRLSKMSRLVGLIPFELIHRLKDLKIKVVGASVAASSIHLLAALGAENIEFADPGKLDPSNSPRMPGGATSDATTVGRGKARALKQELQRLRWYGKYLDRLDKVVCSDDPGEGELPVDALLEDADIVIEVVDDALTKHQLREWIQNHRPDLVTVFAADYGANHPVVSISHPQEEGYRHFNQSLDTAQRAFLQNLVDGKFENDPAMFLKAIYLIVKDELPADHQLQLLTVAIGLMPFFSQTPITSRGSAVMVAEAVLRHLNGEDLSDRNLTLDDASGTFIQASPEQESKISEIINALLG